MLTKFQAVSFKLTTYQVRWLKSFSEKTGLNQVEIVRRALDDYAEAQEAKELQHMFTAEQREQIREVSRLKGTSERDLIRSAIDREVGFMKRLQRKREVQ